MIPYISSITRFHFSAILVKQTQFRSSGYKKNQTLLELTTSLVKTWATICHKKSKTNCWELSKFDRDYAVAMNLC